MIVADAEKGVETARRMPGFWTEPIPLLTKVIQWTPGFDEVTWLYEALPPPCREALVNASSPSSLLSPTLFPELQRLPEQEQILAELVTICKLTQSAVSTIYEDRGVLPRTLIELNAFLERTQVVRLMYDESVYHDSFGPFPLGHSGQGEGEVAELPEEAFDDQETRRHKRAAIRAKGLLPVDGIVEWAEHLTEISAAGVIAQELKRVIVDDSRSLSRCEECKSIFLRSRGRASQRFCSTRCADRNGHRRRYAEKTFLSEEEVK